MPRVAVLATALAVLAFALAAPPAQAQDRNQDPQGSVFTPPPCTPPGPFSDVPHQDPFCPWIQQLVTDQITSGCGGSNYCPGGSVTRAQMAVFIEVAMRGTAAWSPIPTGAVMFFNLAACPGGWSELTAARGRYPVGMPTGGTLAGTAGTALTDLENRPAGQHDHPINDPGHTHSYVNNGIFQNYCGGNFCQTQYGSTQTTSASPTGITVSPNTAPAGTNAPYIQLLICQKD